MIELVLSALAAEAGSIFEVKVGQNDVIVHLPRSLHLIRVEREEGVNCHHFVTVYVQIVGRKDTRRQLCSVSHFGTTAYVDVILDIGDTVVFCADSSRPVTLVGVWFDANRVKGPSVSEERRKAELQTRELRMANDLKEESLLKLQEEKHWRETVVAKITDETKLEIARGLRGLAAQSQHNKLVPRYPPQSRDS